MTVETPSSALVRPGHRSWRLAPLDWASLVLALTLALPIASVIASVFGGPSPTFVHLAETVLGEYVANTLSLGVLVVLGVLAIGVPAAWLAACCEFPGR